MADYTLLTISGSLRGAATNSLLLREAARLFDPTKHIEADLNLPLYDGDSEEADGVPGAVVALAEQIKQADAVAISTPEYNKGPPGVLKNALDWVSRTPGGVWKGKPVAVMSAAAGRAGGERAQLILRTFMVPFQTRLVQGPEVHLADSSNQFDENGQLTSEIYLKTLQGLMDNLRSEIGR